MKKVLFMIAVFLLSFLFLNLRSNETDSFTSLNYYNENMLSQHYFTLKLYDFNIYNLENFDNSNIEIISIIPKENNFNIDKVNFNSKNIKEIIDQTINDYKSKINKNFSEVSLLINNNGFVISKIKVLTTYEELINLENKISFKILSA